MDISVVLRVFKVSEQSELSKDDLVEGPTESNKQGILSKSIYQDTLMSM